MEVPFQHQPLQRARREIRLLKLLPRNQWSSPLLPTCSIFHASIDQCPPYIALSYVWGDQRDRREILVNARTVKVTKNLFEALIGIVGSETIIIWIDAICINQTDDEEKGWQVALMGDIYRNTSEVLAWLGPSADNSDKVMDHLGVLGSIAEACGLFEGTEQCILIWTEMLRTWPKEWDPSRSTPNLNVSPIHLHRLAILLHAINGLKQHKYLIKLDDLEHLCRRPWWERIWVLQEISLPEQAQFICGTKRISRRRFHAALNAYRAFLNASSSVPQMLRPSLALQSKLLDVLTPNGQLMLSMPKLYKQKEFGLVEILQATNFRHTIYDVIDGRKSFLATDPRDKIFALLNLIHDDEELRAWGVFPDYTKLKEEIYTTVMAAMLRQGHTSLLSQACGVDRQGGLPSWVPDWSKPSLETLQVLKRNYSDLTPPFKACGSKGRCDVRFGHVKKRLLVMGTICDEVLRQGHVSRIPGGSMWAWPLTWLHGVEQLTHIIKGSCSNPEVRLQTAARVAHAGIRLKRDSSHERAQMFPETMSFLEKLTQCGMDDGNSLESRQAMSQDFLERSDSHITTGPQRMQMELIRLSYRRLPFVTSKGRLGICSMDAKKGDVVALISGAQTPFVLRPFGGRYMIVSEAYIDGIMDGEAEKDGRWDYIELE